MAGATTSKSKPKTGRVSTARAASAERASSAPVVTQPEGTPDTSSEQLVKTKDMLARVAARAELRPSQVRDIYEAVLEELGAALMRGEKLRLPPLGTVKVNRQKALPDADILICKIRRNRASGNGKDPLAPTDD